MNKNDSNKTLLIFDFDRTIIEEDSDMEIVNVCKDDEMRNDLNNKMKELSDDWIQYMTYVYQELAKKYTIEDIKNYLERNIHLTKQFEDVFTYIRENKEMYEVILLSGANAFNINFLLQRFHIEDIFDDIITNPARENKENILDLGRYHTHECSNCDICMCKGKIIKEILSSNIHYKNIIFICDGSNDFCLGKELKEHDVLCVRKNFSLYKKLYKKGYKDNLKCKISLWENGGDIVHFLNTNK